jgi:hypothetical protein
MSQDDHRNFAATLLDLVWQIEQLLKDYCRLLTANEDGHWLERDSNNDPF